MAAPALLPSPSAAAETAEGDDGEAVSQLPYIRQMVDLMTQASARRNFRAAFSVLVSALSRLPPARDVPQQHMKDLLLTAIDLEQSSHIGVRIPHLLVFMHARTHARVESVT